MSFPELNLEKTAGNFYEFFAGGGMARAGLGQNWQCLFANDFDEKKAITYKKNWGGDELLVQDVETLSLKDLPGNADLVWGSFPCQDLSLAGAGAGLFGKRSGTFWPFWNLIETLAEEGRKPTIIVLENVCGTLTSHKGQDFAAIGNAFSNAGYFFGAVVIDAIHFVPQSRPRLFFVGIEKNLSIPLNLQNSPPHNLWHPKNLRNAFLKLSSKTKEDWIWWNLPSPTKRQFNFDEIVEDNPTGVKWHSVDETNRLLSMMSPVNEEKVKWAINKGRKIVGTIYKRTRKDEKGKRVQRAEIRFDNVAGCLRTPGGGSSRQIIMIVNCNDIRSRLLSPRETARLMGLSENYILPKNYNEAYHLTGDGVVVPVVRFLSTNLIEPLLFARKLRKKEAA